MSIYEALGPVEAQQQLVQLFEDPGVSKSVRRQLEMFQKARAKQGHIPKAVYFASRRYHRWLALNPEATVKAKAGFLKNLYHDYKVQRTETTYPDARVRLFLDTVFHEGNQEIRSLLMGLMEDLRAHRMDGNALQNEIGQFTQSGTLSEEDSMLLKRIAFPELPPSDQIDLIATRSTALEDVEIMISRKDQLGHAYRIRRAMTPKEIINLQQLFDKVNLPVSFNETDEYLVAINENNRVIGGLFYRVEAESAVYLDKIVVSNNYRGRGISRGLIEEFLNRMRNRGYRIIITGFLHPGFFYKFGFQLESNQAGLVKYL
jgi:predicted N-acetyltransferase YhbS